MPGVANPQAWNRYAYASNNPIYYTDPSGHMACNKVVNNAEPVSEEDCAGAIDYQQSGTIPNGKASQLREPEDLEISEAGLQFIMDWETYQPYLYDWDGGGNCTIGYGHLLHLGKCDGQTHEQEFQNGITNERALEILSVDVAVAESTVRKYVAVDLTQNQYDALVSFAYNVGEPNFAVSNVLEDINAANFAVIPYDLSLWINSGDEVAPGLITRRRQEGDMFVSGIYDSTH